MDAQTLKGERPNALSIAFGDQLGTTQLLWGLRGMEAGMGEWGKRGWLTAKEKSLSHARRCKRSAAHIKSFHSMAD